MQKSPKNEYIPEQQDIILIDFDPSLGHEIQKRRPALVMSNQGYSKLTSLVVVCPITHALHNQFRNTPFFIPINQDSIDGYINSLQFFSYDFRKRHAELLTVLDTPSFFQVKQTILDILN
ncbi:type II toxin-antitoxin system PemK/MazF family toxin [Agrilactobacillus fermenti]|uniref:type II toxin-antitoxin system PemK/MazF family toxin n=1 Tax=Agrilactobacillus fermenti TaxID=2586909 RepID=UPI003A5BE8C6